MECIRYWCNRHKVIDALATNLRDIRPDQIRYLPKKQLLKLDPWQIEDMWDELPERYRRDRVVQLRRPCREHYNLPEHESHIDGPPPAKMNCGICRSQMHIDC